MKDGGVSEGGREGGRKEEGREEGEAPGWDDAHAPGFVCIVNANSVHNRRRMRRRDDDATGRIRWYNRDDRYELKYIRRETGPIGQRPQLSVCR